MAWSNAIAKKLLGGIASARGDRAGAAALYAEAAKGFDESKMALYAAVARHRAGEHAGGDEGQHLLAEVRRWMAAQRVEKPLEIVAMIAP